MSLLATEWARRGVQVTLITLSADEDDYPVPAAVERVKLDVMRVSSGPMDALRNNGRRLMKLRRAIVQRKPEVVISFMDITNILVLMATSGTGTRVIVSERVDPRHSPLPKGWTFLRRYIYREAFAVVVQTEQVAQWAEAFLPPEKVYTVPNPVVVPEAAEAGAETHPVVENNLPIWVSDSRWVIAMGRLYSQKGFDLLLRAFARVAEEIPDVNMAILGEGPERPALHALIEELDLRGRVVLSGRINNAWPLLELADCFVVSSRYEGFPNALLEAMAVGAPVVSFNCPSGPSDIIRDGVDGLLVPAEDVGALAAAILQVLQDKELARRLGEAAGESVKRFSIASVTNQWERVIRQETSAKQFEWPTL